LWLFKLNGAEQSVFALGGIFANNVLLGLPIAKVALGDAALPSIALVLVFNTLSLWMLVTVSVEWARNGALSLRGFAKAARGVIVNPIIIAVISGTLFGLTGWTLPNLVDAPLKLLAEAATPLALLVLGMGLAEYGVRQGWRAGLAITGLKLVVQPLIVFLLALAIGLPLLQTQAVVLLAALSVGVNVYMMAREFDVMQSPVAASLVMSTVLSSLTVPLWLSLLGAG
jgi:predicted permease